MTDFIHTWTLEDISVCDELIEYHKNNVEYKSRGTVGVGRLDKKIKDSIDVAVLPYSSHPTIKKYFKQLQVGLDNYVKEFAFANAMTVWNKEPTNIQYYEPGGGYHGWHHERMSCDIPQVARALVYMTYLNDVNDQGETEWYYQKIKIKPKKGLSVIWPSDFTHTHRGIASPTEEKYIITGWWSLARVT